MAQKKTRSRKVTRRSPAKLRLLSIRPGVLTQVNEHNKLVILDPQNQKAFVIDGLAADLWLLMEEERTSSQVLRILSSKSNMTRPQLVKNIQSFVNKLNSLNLVIP